MRSRVLLPAATCEAPSNKGIVVAIERAMARHPTSPDNPKAAWAFCANFPAGPAPREFPSQESATGRVFSLTARIENALRRGVLSRDKRSPRGNLVQSRECVRTTTIEVHGVIFR